MPVGRAYCCVQVSIEDGELFIGRCRTYGGGPADYAGTAVVEGRLADWLTGCVTDRPAIRMTRVGRRQTNLLETWCRQAVEPVTFADLDDDEVVLRLLIEVLDAVWLALQSVLHLEVSHSEVAVQIEDAEAPGSVPATTSLP